MDSQILLGETISEVYDALALQAGSREKSAVHGRNLWPSQLPEFEERLKQYFEACLHTGQILMQGVLVRFCSQL